jgi:hypothetical protein
VQPGCMPAKSPELSQVGALMAGDSPRVVQEGEVMMAMLTAASVGCEEAEGLPAMEKNGQWCLAPVEASGEEGKRVDEERMS